MLDHAHTYLHGLLIGALMLVVGAAGFLNCLHKDGTENYDNFAVGVIYALIAAIGAIVALIFGALLWLT